MLDPDHERGGGKASYFISRGFRAGDWALFAEMLRAHATMHPVAETDYSEYGTQYVIEGPLRLPGGYDTELPVRVIWMVDPGKEIPRFITAYPFSS